MVLAVLALSIALSLSMDSTTMGQETGGQEILIVVGGGGTDEYTKIFRKTALKWEQVASKAKATSTTIGLGGGDTNDNQRLSATLTKKLAVEGDTLWIVFVGHGTFDGKLAKFNLRGPDVTATELATYLDRFKRPVVIVNGASSSAPFINRLSATNRVVVTATDSGYELNYARFGIYLADVMLASEVDLDKDEQTSILEAFLAAAKQTAAFYDENERLATEHALLDDNGDGRGTPATFYRGVRVTKPSKDGQPDGFRANQIQLIRSPRELALSTAQRLRRDALEEKIEAVRARKSSLREDDYFSELERLFLEIAAVYEESRK
ncbi:MAG TPA: hypothetical protein EYQ75_00565 [Planctomycetaceae bacterium]|nr:hypothetical protein [Planctomycetaceae bacterium]